MFGGSVGYYGWTEFCYIGWSWTDVSVLGSQVYGQALMDSCEVALHQICECVKGQAMNSPHAT